MLLPTGGNATASPITIQITTATGLVVPAPTVTGEARTSPAFAAGTVAYPAPAVTADASVTPYTTATSTAEVPDPVATGTSGGGGNAVASPAAFTIGSGAVSLPAATVSGAANIVATSVEITTPGLTVPAPTVSGAGRTTPAAVPLAAGSVALPAPTVTGTTPNGTASPAAILINSGAVAVPTPTLSGTANIAISTPFTPGLSVPAPTVGGGAGTAPISVEITTGVKAPTPSLTGNASTSPAAATIASGAVALPAPTVTGTNGGDATTAPTAIQIAAGKVLVPTVTVTGTANAAPDAFVITVVVPNPNTYGQVPLGKRGPTKAPSRQQRSTQYRTNNLQVVLPNPLVTMQATVRPSVYPDDEWLMLLDAGIYPLPPLHYNANSLTALRALAETNAQDYEAYVLRIQALMRQIDLLDKLQLSTISG